MSTYVVGDIHGCYNEWLAFKNRLEQEDKDAKFILVGDIIDRGQSTVDSIAVNGKLACTMINLLSFMTTSL